MAKAITLPLSEIQLFQKELATKQNNLYRDPEVDKQLCLAYQRGDKDAAIKLMYRYVDKLSYIYRFPTRTKNRGGAKCKIDITSSTTKEDKEDLLMEVIYHFLKLLLEYDPAEGDLQGLVVGKLHLRVFFYHYGDLIDLRMNEQELEDNYDMEEEMKEIFIDEREIPKETKKLYEALSKLTPKQRQILDYTIVKGWNSTEISKETGTRPDTILHAKKAALVKLKKLMEAI